MSRTHGRQRFVPELFFRRDELLQSEEPSFRIGSFSSFVAFRKPFVKVTMQFIDFQWKNYIMSRNIPYFLMTLSRNIEFRLGLLSRNNPV